MSIVGSLVGDQDIRKSIEEETDPIKKIGIVLKDYIPIGVTSFYMTFFAAANAATTNEKELIQYILLPLLSLVATIFLSFFKSWNSKMKKIDWPGLIIPPIALIGWIYVTGGQFFSWAVSPLIAAIIFAFFSLIMPAIYAVSQISQS